MRGSGCYFLIIIQVLCYLVLGCGEDADILEGKRLAEAGDNAAAARYFASMLQREPKHPEAHYRLGLAYGELEKYDEAVAELEKAAILEPKRMDIAFALGRMYWISGSRRKAIKRLLAILERSPGQVLCQQIAGLTGDAFQVKCLANEDADDYSQAFSPSGRMVTFTSKYTDDYSPAFSTDGKLIAFTSYRLQNAEIYLMDTEGKIKNRLTRTDAIDEYMPTFSPDGNLMAFVADKNVSGEAKITVQLSGSTPGSTSIYLMNVDGKEQRRLTDGTAMERAPAFSPDGRRIAFESNEDGDIDIYVINVDGTEKKQLTFNDVDDGHPVFSPDGKKIAFASLIDGNYEICIVDTDGGNLNRLTHNNVGDYQPAFSPDGKHIVFVLARNNDYELWMMNTDGANKKQLTNNVGAALQPSFSPDGEKIVFTSDRTGYLRVYMMDFSQPFSREELQNRLHKMGGEQ